MWIYIYLLVLAYLVVYDEPFIQFGCIYIGCTESNFCAANHHTTSDLGCFSVEPLTLLWNDSTDYSPLADLQSTSYGLLNTQKNVFIN